MNTQCNKKSIVLQSQNQRKVIADFSDGIITSYAGCIVLKEIENKFNIIANFVTCSDDYRNPNYCEHSLFQLLGQRIFAICAGNEDLNDHDVLRNDKLYSLLVGKKDCDKKIAGKSTLLSKDDKF